MSSPIIALGIESSCDDTSAAIVSSDKQILSNVVISQIEEHRPYQGVVPEIAARAHMSYLEHAISKALDDAKLELKDIDIIAATGGPGLIGGVIVGTMFGKALSFATNKPYIAVNHLEGHILTTRLFNDIEYPFLTLLVSGGHAQFIAAFEHGHYKMLGQTLDDAPGEAFDKLAKMLKLGYPGGPIIEQIANEGNASKYPLPLSMVGRSGCDMSFSGLKTAAKLIIDKNDITNSEFVADIAASFQSTVAEILFKRSEKAIQLFVELTGVKHFPFILSGGVAANKLLRSKMQDLAQHTQCTLMVPPIQYCTDNAAMIAWAGIENYHNDNISSLKFCPRPNWPLNSLHQ